jgi:hypothetical protein
MYIYELIGMIFFATLCTSVLKHEGKWTKQKQATSLN